MRVAIILLGIALFGALIARVAMDAERKRRAAAALAARLEALEPTPAKTISSRALAVGGNRPLPAFLQKTLVRADVEARLDVVAISGFGLAASAAALGYFVNLWAGLGLAAAGIICAVYAVQTLAARRTAQFVEALPHFLDAIRQLLIAGYAFQQAFLKSAEDAPPAIRRYLDPAQRRIRNGASTADALTWTADRIDNPELHMLATAVRTNIRFGGAMGPILGELSAMLRNRQRVGRELKAATSEIRTSGLVLTCLPPSAVVIVALINPTYMQALWETSYGRKMLAVAIVLQVTGMFVMRRLMRLNF